MKRISTKDIVLAALFIALGFVLPFFTGQIPNLGNKLLPMHLPVLLCGFVCGGPIGLLVGFILPIFRSLMFGMPPMYPTALAMAFELGTYGLMTGLLAQVLPKKIPFLYVNLIASMIIGRIVWGAVSLALYGIKGTAFTWQMFMAAGFVNAIPGIIVQIVVIPLLVIALQRAKMIQYERT